MPETHFFQLGANPEFFFQDLSRHPGTYRIIVNLLEKLCLKRKVSNILDIRV